ncbi:hypothetical protein [Salinibacterium xinjiangense]|uniref:hypothetical protein n=1 Tax=Salinibacterium xinjiangense TaxID=386302 RepID=UPI000BE4253C|nr:hypothetical protein [Salinibacterium xinjiangense]
MALNVDEATLKNPKPHHSRGRHHIFSSSVAVAVAVARATVGREIVNVIVRAPRLVNIATKPA